MNWFEEQIKLRCERDGEALDEALKNVSAMIEGRKRQPFEDDREKIKSALDDVLAYYGVRPHELPPDIKEVNDQIEYLCRPNGVMYRSVKLERGWYRDAVGAFLGTLKTGEVVALIPDKLGRYRFFTPTRRNGSRLGAERRNFWKKMRIASISRFPSKKSESRT